MIREPLIFEISEEGKRAYFFPKLDIPEKKDYTDDLIEMIDKAYQLVAEQKERIKKAEIDNILKKRGW